MSEPAIMVLLVSGVACWLLGGYRWKWVRRFALPIIVTGTLATAIPLFFAALVGLTTCVVNVLPYGERTPWPVKLLVFASYGLPGVWLDTPFCLLYSVGCAVVLGGVMWLSQRYQRVTHKLWEALAGLLQAAGIVLASLR